MRAKACIKCKEYIVLHPNNPLSQNKEHLFARAHHMHTLVTVNLDEVKDTYKPFKNGSENHVENGNNA